MNNLRDCLGGNHRRTQGTVGVSSKIIVSCELEGVCAIISGESVRV